MNHGWTTDDLLAAAGEYCNGTIDEATGRRLDAALASDPQARRLYANYMWLHASLFAENGSLHTVADRGEATCEEAAQWLALDRPTAAPGPGAFDAPRRRSRWTPLWIAAAMAAVAAFSSWAALSISGRNSTTEVAQGPVGEGAAPSPAPVVARVTGTRNCMWRRPELGIGYGSQLAAGQRVELDEGLVEITFEDGATVLLEGPAVLDVDTMSGARLSAGRLAAIVPERAHGFRIRTAGLDVFDAGAEYGVSAQETGAAEVHVFNGAVRADVLDAEGRPTRRLELASAQAARINRLSTTVLEFPADDAMFVRNIAPSAGPGDGLLAAEHFSYPEGPLEAQNGGFGWAGPWFNLSVDEEAGPGSNQVKPGSLAVEGLVPTGNRAIIAAQKNRIRRALGTSVGGVFDAEGLVENKDEVRLVGRDGKQVYLSFLQRVSATSDGFYGVELHRGDGNGNRVLCVGNGADGAAYGATSNVNVYGAENLPSLGEENTGVNFFVVKITFGVENRDVAEVYRNPASLRSEGACQPTATLRGNFAFDRISLANFDGKKVHEVDEILIGTHFLAVTGRWGNNQGRLLRQVTAAPRQRFDRATAWRSSWETADSRLGETRPRGEESLGQVRLPLALGRL